MATPYYPATLPGPTNFSLTSAEQVLTGDNDGPKDLRRFSIVPGAVADVSFRYLEDDYATFKAWLKDDLLRGLRWFYLTIPSAGGLLRHVVRWIDRPQGAKRGHRYWEVRGQLEIRERLYEPPADDTYFFLEDFENGFDAYELVSGSLTPFRIQEGLTDHCMHSDPWTSGAQAIIQRVVDPFLASFISFRYRCTTLGSDDSMAFEFAYGASTFAYALPIREGFYDAPRRVVLFYAGGAGIPVSDVRITLDHVYRGEIDLVAGTYTHIDEEAGTILKVTAIPGAVPHLFDRLRFRLDASIGSCETDVDDIFMR